MPAKDSMLEVRNNFRNFQVMSKIVNVQNDAPEFKFTITKYPTGSSDKSAFQETIYKAKEETFTFEKKDPGNPRPVASKRTEYSQVNQNIYNESYLPNLTTENKESADLKILESSHEEKFDKKSETVLRGFSVKELRLIAADLAQLVNDVSNKLVSLLQENDTLRQESDARNIAIEQLLKLTVKQAENELRPVKMSVVASKDESDDEWD